METIYLSRSVTVTGGSGYINMDNYINLHSFVLQLIQNASGGVSPVGAITTANNGLISSGTNVQMGGALIRNTDILGDFNWKVGSTTSNNFISTGDMPYAFTGQKGSYLSSGTANFHALNGVLNGEVILYKEDVLSNEIRSISLNNNEIELKAQASGTNNIVIDDASIVNTVSQGASSQYFTLTDTGFTIGNTGGGPYVPAVGSKYLMPNVDGLTDQVLTTNGVGITSWESLPSLAAFTTGAENGLNVVNKKVRLGGNLITNTDIFLDDFVFTLFNPSSGAYFTFDDTELDFKSGNSRLSINGTMSLRTPGYYTTLNSTPTNSYGAIGRVFQNVNVLSGEAEFSPFTLPTAVGTLNQILVTDSNGNLVHSNAVTNLNTLTGVSINNSNLATFTGNIITDNSSIKTALQELEVAVSNNIGLVDNGLTEVIQAGPNKIQLGGSLIQDTTIAGGTKLFNMNNLGSMYLHGDSSQLIFNGSLELESEGSISLTTATTGQLNIVTPSVAATTSAIGQILQLTNASTGKVEYTPYALPTVDGTVNQVLKTDGAGKVTWEPSLSSETVYLQEFPTGESIYDRDGFYFFVVPSSMNGATMDSFQWSVFDVNTGTFTITVEKNGINIPGATVGVTSSSQNGVVIFTPVTVSTHDRIRVKISDSAGEAPFGLTSVFTLNK